MAHDVFISHSAKDKTTADAVCAMLESEGIRCWIAPRDVLPSMEWGEAIIDAIQECRIMVLVFTASANASPQIRREVERAVNHGVAILPLRVEDVLPAKALEYFIGNVHWLDALSAPFEAHLKNLAGTIKVVLARMEPRDAPPVLQKAAGEASRESEVPGQVATSETGLKPVESSSTETPATSAETTPRSVDISGPAETPTVEIGPPPSDAQPTSHEHRTEASDAGPRKPRIPRAWIFVILGGVVVLIASHHFVYWCWNHWVARNSDTQNYYYSIFGTADGRRLWAVGLMGEITESDDGGATWKAREIGTKNEDLRSIFGTSDGQRLWAVGGAGAILESDDGGATWTERNSGTNYEDLHSIFGTSDGQRLWVVGMDGTILESDDGGATWTARKSGTKEWLESIFGTGNGQRLWAVGAGDTILESDDGGATWAARKSGAGDALNSIFGSSDGQRLWAVGYEGALVKSEDGGATWMARNSGTKKQLHSIFGSSDGQRLWTVGDEGMIVESDDAGATWTPRNSGTGGDLQSIFGTSDGKRLWASGVKGTILASDDGGATWTARKAAH